MTYTTILKILSTLELVAQECLANFGEGARLEYDSGGAVVRQQEEMTFSLCNTPVQSGYCRVVVAPHIAAALQWLKDNGVTSEHVEIVRVEWHGQNMVPVEREMLDEDGQPTGVMETVYEEHLFQVGMSEPVTLEDGTVIPAAPVYLGRIG